MMMRSFEADLEKLRQSSEALRTQLASSRGEAVKEDVPRVIPEEPKEAAIGPIFQSLCTY